MASTYLQRTQSGTETDSKKATISAWVKLSQSVGNFNAGIFGTYVSGNYGADGNSQIGWYNGGLYAWFKDGGSTYYKQESTRRFRDNNAWYHVVYRFDMTQSTASNRIRIYLNGEEITSFASSNNPGSTQNIQMNNGGRIVRVGTYNFLNGTHNYLDGLMSHFYFCDGYSYAPTEFGETDSTTGEWKIKTQTNVNHGTNGFLILKDGNTVTDQSANSNDLSVAAGTLTKTEDNPSNIFCTVNPVFAHNISGAYTPNLVQGNTTWYPSSNAGHSWGRSTLGWTSGKYYMEFKIEEANAGQSSGVFMVPTELPQNISPQTPSNTTYGWQVQFSGSDQNFYTTNGGTTVATITSSVGSNPIIMMAIDADNNKMWVGHNGTWYNNNNASTTLNNSHPDHTWTPGTYGDMYQLSFQSYYNSSNYNNSRANFGNGYFGTTAVSSAGTNASNNGIFEYDVPSGFTALSTKGLNL
jgi:hypothetical protein